MRRRGQCRHWPAPRADRSHRRRSARDDGGQPRRYRPNKHPVGQARELQRFAPSPYRFDPSSPRGERRAERCRATGAVGEIGGGSSPRPGLPAMLRGKRPVTPCGSAISRTRSRLVAPPNDDGFCVDTLPTQRADGGEAGMKDSTYSCDAADMPGEDRLPSGGTSPPRPKGDAIARPSPVPHGMHDRGRGVGSRHGLRVILQALLHDRRRAQRSGTSSATSGAATAG